MGGLTHETKPNGRRRSILELAPLELDCMNALWPLGEATVRDIRKRVAAFRPRAYTTIMTIMDRLAQKGVVTRRKAGRAYLYSPKLTAEQARSRAIARLLEGFFGGSTDELVAHLDRSGLLAGLRPARTEKRPPRRTELPGPSEPAAMEDSGEVARPSRIDESLL